MEVVKPKIVTLRMNVKDVKRNKMKIKLERYGLIIGRKKKKGKYEYKIYIARINNYGDLDRLGIIKFKEPENGENNPIEVLAEKIKALNDGFLSEQADEVAKHLYHYLSNWDHLLIDREFKSMFSVPLLEGGKPWEWDRVGGTTIRTHTFNEKYNLLIDELLNNNFEYLINFISNNFNPKMGELLEIIISVGITLKQVDRASGMIHNRPVWLVIVADPSSYKNTVLGLLRHSQYTFFNQNFTPASILPAKNEYGEVREALIDLIHNKIFIIPTLSEEVSDKDKSKQVFAALESIYDGEYSRSTGTSGHKSRPVDTVIISAVTPAVWEWVLPYIVNIGSRWLVYRYRLDDEEALSVQEKLEEHEELWVMLERIVSRFFDILLSKINHNDLRSIIISDKYKEELRILARLVARLRVVWKVETYWEVNEDTGRRTPIKEVEVYQREAPSRAYQQLVNFVRANTLVRKASVEKIVGIPVVDEHAMKLAAKLALGSTTNNLRDLILFIAKNQANNEELSIRKIAAGTGISKSTVERLLKVLRHPRVDLIDDYWYVKEPYFSIIKKYFLSEEGDRDEDDKQ